MTAPTWRVTTPTDREIVMTRVFDAPRRLAFEALTRPELLRRWLLGPSRWELVVCQTARLQLFPYLEACGHHELNTLNLWAGRDAA